MARIRTVKPEFWQDEQIASWPRDSRLCYIGLWNEADDQGRLRASASYLKSRIFPYDDDVDMQSVLAPIIASGKLITYEVAGQTYGVLPKFQEHQKINRPSDSRFPPAPKQKQQTTNVDSVKAHGGFTEDSLKAHCCIGSGNGSGNGMECAREESVNPKSDPIADGTCQDILAEMDAEQTKAKPDRASLKQNGFRLTSLASALERWSRDEILLGWRWCLKSPDAEAIWNPPGRGVNTFLKPDKIDGYIEAAITAQKSLSRPPPPEDDGPGSAAEVRRRREAFERKKREDEQRKRDGESAGEWAASQAAKPSG